MSKSNRLTKRIELSSLRGASVLRAALPLLIAGALATATVAFTVSVAKPALAEGGDLARGEQVYELCQKCHGANGEGNSEVLAPSIAGLPSWYIEAQLKNFKSGARGLHAKDTGGLRMYPMSQWLRKDEDLTAVTAYVAAMPKTAPDAELEEPGDAKAGAGYYAVCSACHGANGGGNQGMGAPPLAGMSDWYLYSSISKYKNRIRGTGRGDALGAAMIGMAGTLPDDQAIRDVIAHIQTLEN
ncbi:MAG: cytochrome c [Myxococcota bacterium]